MRPDLNRNPATRKRLAHAALLSEADSKPMVSTWETPEVECVGAALSRIIEGTFEGGFMADCFAGAGGGCLPIRPGAGGFVTFN